MTGGAAGCSAAGVLVAVGGGGAGAACFCCSSDWTRVLKILDRLQRLIEQVLELFIGLRLRAAAKGKRQREQQRAMLHLSILLGKLGGGVGRRS